MFRSTFDQKIDEKGRVNVPAKFRDVLRGCEDDRLFITNFVVHKTRCLEVIPYAAWLRLEERLQERSERSDLESGTIQVLQNYYIAGAAECQLDKQGRILIPPRLREYAKLVKDVVFTGAMSKFRIWDHDSYYPVFAAGEEILMNDPDVVKQLGL